MSSPSAPRPVRWPSGELHCANGPVPATSTSEEALDFLLGLPVVLFVELHTDRSRPAAPLWVVVGINRPPFLTNDMYA